MTGLTNAFVKAGGAIINTGTFNDTIGQNLLTDTVSTGGGLTKQGAGTLTLTGANTYTGGTTIGAGTLQVGNAAALGASAGAVSVTSGAVLDLFGTPITNTYALTLNGTGITNGGALVNSSATAASYAGPITLGTGTTITLNGLNVSSVSIVANSGALTTTGAITTTSNGADDTLTLGGTGTGGNDVQSTLSDAGSNGFGLIVNKTGTGTWTLGGNATSALARGNIVVSAGTLNFGSATEAPTLTAATVSASSPNGSALYMNGGTLNIVNGTLTLNTTTSGAVGLYDTGSGGINVSGGSTTVNASQGLVLNSTQTYTQTGGTFTTNGYIELANGGGVSTVNVSAGSLTTTASAGTNGSGHSFETVRGTSTTTVSGTGTITTPLLDMTTSQIGNGNAVNSTFNLGNGTAGQGTLVTGQIIDGDNGATTGATPVVGNQTFNFNGGTLQSSASTVNFMPTGTGTSGSGILGTAVAGNEVVQVRNGGAIINTAGFNDTIAQPLLHSAVGGDNATDGGLTKQGAGTLTLSGANTYTGLTTVSTGALVINGANTGAGAVNVNGGTLLGRGTAPSGMLSVASGANLAPGATVAANGTTAATAGALTVGALTLTTGSNFNVLLAENGSTTGTGAGTIYSQLITTGAASLAGNLNLNLTGTLAVGDKFFILDNSGSGTTSGTFANIVGTTFTTGGETFAINYGDTFDATSGNDISLTVTAVPEPSTWVGGLLSLGALVLHLRRRLFAAR